MASRRVPKGEGPVGWRGDRVTLRFFWAAFTVLTATVAFMIELGVGFDFWAWVITAGAILTLWVGGVLSIGRSAETPEAEGASR